MKRSLFGAVALAAVALSVVLIGAAAGSTVTTPNGTWTAYPGQSTSYSAALQPPINLDGSSNWPAKSKGGIPIMFKLSSGTGPFLFQSIYSDGASPYTGTGPCSTGTTAPHLNDCSYLQFTPNTQPTLAEISSLIATYAYTSGDCQGGSLRWTLYLNDNGVTRSLDIHYQPGENALSDQFCQTGTSGTNRVDLTSTDPYVVIQGFTYSGTPYNFSSPYNVTYDEAVGQLGNLPVLAMNLALDSGWGAHGDQVVNLTNATVGVGGATPYTETFTPQSTSGSAPTCDLPPATLKMTKTSGTASGVINETDTVQQNFDNGNAFRVVDCKYQYVLAVPSLIGVGSYHAEIQIGGTTVGNAYFDLK
jgi:hypothetical protein